jgi:N-acetylmuramoyl-L-alanine amidase
MIIWKSSVYSTLNVDFDGAKLTVRFGMQKNAPQHAINPFGTMFENISIGTEAGAPCYNLTLKTGAKLEGYYVDFQNNELRLHLKKRKALAPGDKPLTGFSFVIDAGHGDTDTGAVGPMGAAMCEKMINLANSKKLASKLAELGANVKTVRDTDVFYSLYQRTEISRGNNPDLFISLHCNSMPETTDASNIRGLTVWYRNKSSLPLADSFTTSLFRINPGTTRASQTSYQSNFYVCRPPWAPSIIIEASFMCNIDDFAWLINDAMQVEYTTAIANAILAYYRS